MLGTDYSDEVSAAEVLIGVAALAMVIAFLTCCFTKPEKVSKPVESKTYTITTALKLAESCKQVGGVPMDLGCNISDLDAMQTASDNPLVSVDAFRSMIKMLDYKELPNLVKCRKFNGTYENKTCKVGEYVLELQELDSYLKTKEILDSARVEKEK